MTGFRCGLHKSAVIKFEFHCIFFVSMCIKGAEDPEEAVQVVKELPTLNKLVLSYLIRFLQVNSPGLLY